MTRIAITTALLTCLAVGCAQHRDKAADEYGVVQSSKAPDAPLTVTVKVTQPEITVADTFRCIIEIKRGEEVTAAMPEFAALQKSFAPLLARDRRTLPRRIEGHFVVEADEYELEPLVSGACTIKPFTVTYTVNGQEHTLKTEPIELAVTSLGADDPRAQLRDIAGPVELTRRRAAWWLWVGVAVVVVAGVVIARVLAVARSRRRKAPAAKPLAAHEIAFNAFRALREKDYIGRGMIKPFYIELSAILRWYIETRFGLHAPEETTQEFLMEISRDGFFDVRRRALLKEFLEHCDLVKFATYGPAPNEIEGAFSTATTFVDETKETGSGGV